MSQGMHPVINSLVRFSEKMWDCLAEGKYVEALGRMWVILGTIKVEDDKENMFEKIVREQNYVQSLGDERRKRNHISGASTTYRKWARDIDQILWRKDYLINKKYTASGLDEFEKDEGYVEA